MIWRRLFHNIGWKFGSLMLAILLWFAVVGEPEVATTHTVPILYKNLPRDLLVGSNAIDSVRVELRGPGTRLTTAALADVAMTLDLSGVAGPGERTFTLSDADLRLPDGVTLLRSIPSQVRLRFAHLKARDVPVEIRFSNALPAGCKLTLEDATPQTERIAGPENRVDTVETAQTDAIDLSTISQTSTLRVNTFVPDPQVWLESSPVVTVRLVIEKTNENK